MAQRSQDPIAFLETYAEAFPDDTFVQVCAMRPDSGKFIAQSAPADDVEQLRPFVEKHRGDKNIYFSINALKRPLNKKASKSDIAYVCFQQADIDPDPTKALATERKRIRAMIDRAELEPTWVIDSGGGHQVLYQLEKPILVNGNASQLEQGSKALENIFGADHCSNIDRVFRLPGTTNFPNKTKRAKGRKQAPAKLIHESEYVYDPDAFGSPDGAASDNDSLTISRQIQITDVDVNTLSVSPAVRQLILTGQSPERAYRSRSEAFFAAISALKRAGYDDSIVFSVMLNTTNALSAHAWDQGSAEKATRAVEQVLAKIAADPNMARSSAEHLDKLTATLVVVAPTFVKRKLPPRGHVVDCILPERGITLVAGAKSVGKTMFILTMLCAIATGAPGKTFLGFKIPKKLRSLFVDGEMTAKELQDRIRHLCGDKVPAYLDLLSSEDVRDAIGGSLKINNPLHQEAFFRMLDELAEAGRRPEVIALDNLSTLCHGMDENSNSGEMDNLVEFLLRLRHAGYSVIVVHHLNKEGSQRGGSRKEDPVDVSIVLSELSKRRQNAAFSFWIKSIRGPRPKPDRFTCELVTDPKTKRPKWQVESMPEPDGFIATLAAIDAIEPSTQADLVRVFGIEKTKVSRHVRKLREKGLVDAKKLAITDDGRRYLDTVESRHGELRLGLKTGGDA